jgi:hypothetical protein
MAPKGYIKRILTEAADMYPEHLPVITFAVNCINIEIKNVRFIIYDCYPFKCPSVFVFDRPYSHFLKSHSPRITKLLHTLKYPCLCCNTVICDWSPSYRLTKIIDEITDNNLIKRQIKYYMILEDIAVKYPKIASFPNLFMEFLL